MAAVEGAAARVGGVEEGGAQGEGGGGAKRERERERERERRGVGRSNRSYIA